MKLSSQVCALFILCGVTLGNTITQFIRLKDTALIAQSFLDNDPNSINISVKYSDLKQLNDVYEYIAVENWKKDSSYSVNFFFTDVPVLDELSKNPNSFFNKICWSPISSIELDDLGFWFEKESKQVIVHFSVIPLSNVFSGFTIYISLEKLIWNLLPLSIIYLISYITAFIIVISLFFFFFYKKIFVFLKTEIQRMDKKPKTE
ncbi:hypothetical protein QEN19_004328 [Hanseniaspora menglaensis]